MALQFHSISIRRKVTFVILLTCLLALLASGAMQLISLDSQGRRNLEQDLRMHADLMGQNFAGALLLGVAEFPADELRNLHIDTAIDTVCAGADAPCGWDLTTADQSITGL